jgi:RHS repeat-associated protein
MKYATHRYDGLGRRIEKNVNGKITRYVYDNEDIILEYDGENRLVAEYIHGPGIDEPLMMERDGKIYYYIPDALGSIRALVDTKGYIRQMYEYDAFGGIKVLDEEGKEIDPEDGIPNLYTFTGREFDPETGLYYYRARYYDPSLGRFLQEDPILYLQIEQELKIGSKSYGGNFNTIFNRPLEIFLKEPQILNLYPYCQNNPVNLVDPMGLSTDKGGIPNWKIKLCRLLPCPYRDLCCFYAYEACRMECSVYLADPDVESYAWCMYRCGMDFLKCSRRR